MNTLNVLKQNFSVKYFYGSLKGEIDELIPGKSWVKTFKFKEEQIPCTFKFEIISHCLFGSVNYDLAIYQDFEKLKEEYGTLTHKDSQILVKVNHGIYRVFIQNKSKLIGQNLQFSIESTSFTVQDKVLQVGDKAFVSQPIVVLTKQEPMKLGITLKPIVKPNERIHVDYGVVISREFESKKIIKESEKRINFRASFTQAIQDKNLNQITALFKDPLLKDKQFQESMTPFITKAMELYHEANETVRNIKESIKCNSVEVIQKSLEVLKDFNPSYFEHLEAVEKEANNAIEKIIERKKCYQELEVILKREPHFTAFEEIQKIKKVYKEKFKESFEPITENEKYIFEKLEKYQKEVEELFIKEKERKKKDLELIMNLETLIMLDNIQNIENFLNENKNSLPPIEYQKGLEQLKEIKDRKELERIEEMKKDKFLYQKYLDEKMKKYQLEKEAEEKERKKIEDEKRKEQLKILELQRKEIEYKKEEERKEKERREAEERKEREKREAEEKRLKLEREKKEREEREKKELEEREKREKEEREKKEEYEKLEKQKKEEEKLKLELNIEKKEVVHTIKKALSSSDVSDSPSIRKVTSPDESPKSTSEKRKSGSFILDSTKKLDLQKTHSYNSLLPEKDSPDQKTIPSSVVPVSSPLLSPRSSTKLPTILENLHKSTITIIRLVSLQNDPNYVVRKIFPFVEDIDTIVESLMEILESNRSVSFFFKIPTSPIEIAKKINSKAVSDFYSHLAYKSFKNETQKFTTEIKFFVQFLLHYGYVTNVYQTLIIDQKYASTVYTNNSIIRNEQFKDEMIITFDLLGQIKMKFDVFLDPNDVIKVDYNTQPIVKEVPLSEPLSISVKKSKKKKVHQTLITNIKIYSNEIVEYFISQGKNRNMVRFFFIHL